MQIPATNPACLLFRGNPPPPAVREDVLSSRASAGRSVWHSESQPACLATDCEERCLSVVWVRSWERLLVLLIDRLIAYSGVWDAVIEPRPGEVPESAASVVFIQWEWGQEVRRWGGCQKDRQVNRGHQLYSGGSVIWSCGVRLGLISAHSAPEKQRWRLCFTIKQAAWYSDSNSTQKPVSPPCGCCLCAPTWFPLTCVCADSWQT